MGQDQPRADASATIDPATIAGSQTHPYDSEPTSTSDNPLIPSNDSIDSPVPSTNDSDSTSVPTSDSPTNPLVSSSTSPGEPLVPSSDSAANVPSSSTDPPVSSDSLDSPNTLVSPDSQLTNNSVTALDTPNVLVSSDSTNSGSTPSDSYSEVKPRQYTDIKPVGPTNAIVSQSKSTIRDKAFKFNKTAVVATVAALSVIVAVGIGSLVLTSSNGNNASISGNNKPITTNYKPQSLSVGNITGYNQLLTGKNQNLKVNGQLSVSNSIVLSPTTTPTSPTLGQLYYNSSTNTPYLYNGKSFISLIPSVGGTIAGASTSLSLGNGLGLQGSNLVSTGVTSLSGTPGQIIASASNGSIKLSLPSNLTIAGNFTTTNGLVTNNLEADYITGNGYGITDINPNALPSTLAYQNKNNTFTSPQAFKNSTNSTDSFSIQDAAGNTLLSADTTTDNLSVSNLLPEDPGVSVQGVTQNSIIADSGNDGYNDNGQWSVMGSDGLMRFVYTNWTTDTIHYVRCENTSCTTYIDQPIETDATNDLDSPTIALDKNGDAYIAYIDYTSPTNSWHIAHCSDENCSTATIEDLSQTNAYGYNGSIAVDGQDHADLVYDTYDYSVSPQLYSLEFIHCQNTDCSSNTDTTLASSNSNNGGDYYETSSVVTAPDGYPRVAYVNNGTDSLIYDNCSGSYDCSSYTSNVVDNGNAGYWMAMAVGSDDLAKFVYEDEITGNALEYAACNDAACSTATKTQLVSGTDSYGGYGSIALTANNLPVISSYTEPDDSPPANLLYIYCSDADCTSPLTKTVGSLGTRGYSSNIGITGNNLPMITYIYQDNGSDASIDSVTLGDITGSAITTGTNIGSSSDTFGTVYAQSIQTNGLTSNNGELIVQSTPNSANDFTVQDASGNDLLNVNSLDDTTTLLSSNDQATTGPNLITYSDFSNYWYGNNWTLTDTTATYTGSGTDTLYDDYDYIDVGIGVYQVTLTITGDTNGGCITPAIAYSSGEPICGNGSSLTEEIDFTYAVGGSLTFTPDSNFNGTISGVEVQQISASSILSAGYGSTPQSAQPIFNVNTEGGVGINTTSSIPYSFYGPNLITDPNYNDGSWTGNNWTMNPTSATYTGSGGDSLTTNQFTSTQGTYYYVSLTVSNNTGSNAELWFYIDGATCFGYTVSNGTLNGDCLTTAPGNVSIVPYGDFNGTISNVEVQQIYSEPVLTVQDSQNNPYADLFVANNANGNVLTVDNQGDLTTTGAVQGNTLTLQGDNLNSTPGPNLITDPNYNDGSWTGNNWTMNPTSATYTGSGGDGLTTNQFIPTPGDEYQVTFTESGNTNDGCIGIGLGGEGWSCYYTGTFTLNFYPYNSDPLTFIPDNPFNGTISNVSVEQLIPSNVLEVDSNGSTELSVDGDGTLTLNHLASSNSSNYLCLNSSNQVAGCNGTSGPINNGTTTQDNANFNIQSASAADIGGVIQGASGQTADLLDLDNNNGDVLDSFNANGDLQIGGANSTNSTTAFQVQDANDNSVLAVDTVNRAVGINGASTDAGYALNVTGSVDVSSSILPPVTVNNIGTPGSQDITYQVVGLNGDGNPVNAAPYSVGVTATANSTLNTTNYNALSWLAVPGAVSYNVYRLVGNIGLIGNTASTTLNDTGQSISSSTLPNIGSISDTTIQTGNGGPSPIFVSGNYFYIFYGNDLQIWDDSNPASPAQISNTTLDYGENSNAVISGSYIYFMTGGENSDTYFEIYNISNPAAPTLVSETETSTNTSTTGYNGIAVIGNYIYLVNNAGSTFQIYNISNPATPSLVSSTGASPHPSNLTVQGDYAYFTTAGGSGLLHIFNISNPAAPVAESSTSGVANGIVVGNYLYSTSNGGYLQIYNVSNPIAVALVSNTPFNTSVAVTNYAINVEGGYAYVGTNINSRYANAFLVYNISNPAAPVYVGAVRTDSGNVSGVVVQGAYTYVANSYNGGVQSNLEVFNLGGLITQDLQAVSAETGSLTVDNNENVTGSSFIGGNLQDAGSAFFQDSTNSATAFQVQNASGTNLLNVDTANNIVRLGSLTYSTGTISQAGTTTVTGMGTSFSAAMVGGTLIYSDGSSALITGYTNTTTITVSVSKTVSSGSTYQIQYSGLSVSSTGNVLLQTSTNSTTAFQIQNSSGQALLTADTSGMIITISGTSSSFATLTLNNAHIALSQTTAPTISTPINCGSSPTASVTSGSTDSGGSFSIKAGTGAPTTCDTVITFNKAYSSTPKTILLTSESGTGVAKQMYVSASGASSFTVTMNVAPAASESNSYYYLVLQ